MSKFKQKLLNSERSTKVSLVAIVDLVCISTAMYLSILVSGIELVGLEFFTLLRLFWVPICCFIFSRSARTLPAILGLSAFLTINFSAMAFLFYSAYSSLSFFFFSSMALCSSAFFFSSFCFFKYAFSATVAVLVASSSA